MLQWGRAFSGTEIDLPVSPPLTIGVLQWGRAFSGTEIIHVQASGRCIHTLQWGRAFSGTEISMSIVTAQIAVCGFNGAVPFQARKLIVGVCEEIMGILLQWGRAFSGTEIRGWYGLGSRTRCFNGAVPFQARKFITSLSFSTSCIASMGPCLFRHGNKNQQKK